MHFPLHAGHGGGVDPVAILVGALVGVAIWFTIRWMATRGRDRRRDGL